MGLGGFKWLLDSSKDWGEENTAAVKRWTSSDEVVMEDKSGTGTVWGRRGNFASPCDAGGYRVEEFARRAQVGEIGGEPVNCLGTM